MESEKLTIGIPPKESKLKSLLCKPKPRAPIITVFGEGGVGKTSLLSLFPNPVLIRTEDGSQAIAGKSVYMFEQAYSRADIVEQLTLLLTEDHKLKTVGIDSITKMHLLFEQEVLASDKTAKSINTALGGYGAGNKAIAKMHAEIRHLCGLLNTVKGMTVVFIAHAEMATVDLPDAPSYSRYSIRLQEKSMPYYTDDVDLVGLIRLKTFTTKDDDKRVQAVSTNDRIISCHASANSIAKNRFGITEDIPYNVEHIANGINPLASIIPLGE